MSNLLSDSSRTKREVKKKSNPEDKCSLMTARNKNILHVVLLSCVPGCNNFSVICKQAVVLCSYDLDVRSSILVTNLATYDSYQIRGRYKDLSSILPDGLQ
jgi:hypothetical protein